MVPGVWRGSLPLVRDLREFVDAGGKSAVDLTQRPRDTQQQACKRFGLVYIKHGLPYINGDYDSAVDIILGAQRPVWFWCFHGRDRADIVARRITMREKGTVVLYRVGRNMNRAYRTCEAFGVRTLRTVECNGGVGGNLYSAAGRVNVIESTEIPQGRGVVALETWADKSICAVDWSGVHTLLVGGESSGLPRRLGVDYAHIRQCGLVSGLTVEAALAIALHAWRGG